MTASLLDKMKAEKKEFDRFNALARAAITYEQRSLAVEVVTMKERLTRTGLYKTAAAMEEVTKRIGWEICDVADAKVRAREAKKKARRKR
jgi:hypothetical protein